MKVGKYELGIPVLLAPMAGVTDKAFRDIVRQTGGRYLVTEMINDKALTYHNSKTLSMLNLSGETEPVIVQIFGSEPLVMAQAAKLVAAQGASIIDINMGCPTPKIVKNGGGAALLKDLDRARAVAEAVVNAVSIPVTAKMRLGWDKESIVASQLTLMLEEVGIAMVTVHARTREQFYSGNADWAQIKHVKEHAVIPVVGNGDITTPEEAAAMLAETSCDGVMIGRGALGNPWLISRTQKYLEQGILEPEPSFSEKIKVAINHFELLVNYKGERIGLNEMRKHAAWYVKGLKGAALYRDYIMRTKDVKEMNEILLKIAEEISKHE